MKKIVVGSNEIEVDSLTPYAYDGGKGDKVLKINVSAEIIGFEGLREVLENSTEPIQYYEDDTLVCEYVGYGVFEAQYKCGFYLVELHKTSIDEQMSALLVANENLNIANATLQKTANSLAEQNYVLAEQNIMLNSTLSEVLEIIIPSATMELVEMVGVLDERVTKLETVTDETVSE